MENFNRGNRSGGERNFSKPSYSSGRPNVMHQATCGKCGKNCEVPFRPTNNRPVFCSSCFENNRPSDSGRFENTNPGRSANFNDREMFDAVCDECGSNCQVPFKPSSGKPIYCSNCFGDKREGRDRTRESFSSAPQDNKQFEQLNSKLDKILLLLTSSDTVQPVQKSLQEEPVVEQDEVQNSIVEEVVKVAKKRASKKKE